MLPTAGEMAEIVCGHSLVSGGCFRLNKSIFFKKFFFNLKKKLPWAKLSLLVFYKFQMF